MIKIVLMIIAIGADTSVSITTVPVVDLQTCVKMITSQEAINMQKRGKYGTIFVCSADGEHRVNGLGDSHDNE